MEPHIQNESTNLKFYSIKTDKQVPHMQPIHLEVRECPLHQKQNQQKQAKWFTKYATTIKKPNMNGKEVICV